MITVFVFLGILCGALADGESYGSGSSGILNQPRSPYDNGGNAWNNFPQQSNDNGGVMVPISPNYVTFDQWDLFAVSYGNPSDFKPGATGWNGQPQGTFNGGSWIGPSPYSIGGPPFTGGVGTSALSPPGQSQGSQFDQGSWRPIQPQTGSVPVGQSWPTGGNVPQQGVAPFPYWNPNGGSQGPIKVVTPPLLPNPKSGPKVSITSTPVKGHATVAELNKVNNNVQSNPETGLNNDHSDGSASEGFSNSHVSTSDTKDKIQSSTSGTNQGQGNKGRGNDDSLSKTEGGLDVSTNSHDSLKASTNATTPSRNADQRKVDGNAGSNQGNEQINGSTDNSNNGRGSSGREINGGSSGDSSGINENTQGQVNTGKDINRKPGNGELVDGDGNTNGASNTSNSLDAGDDHDHEGHGNANGSSGGCDKKHGNNASGRGTLGGSSGTNNQGSVNHVKTESPNLSNDSNQDAQGSELGKITIHQAGNGDHGFEVYL